MKIGPVLPVLFVLVLHANNIYSQECKTNKQGKNYGGKISKTQTGKICQRWDSKSPHNHTQNDPEKFPDDRLADAANYCRNPDSEPNGPWCYTMDENTRWEFCTIPACDCKEDDVGRNYAGPKRVTKSGKNCQRWDSQTPHNHNHDIFYLFPGRVVKQASNYCRNPDGKSDGPWCYTTDPATRWEYCTVPSCFIGKLDVPQPRPRTGSDTVVPAGPLTPPQYGIYKECKYSTRGTEYKGHISKTRSGRTCQYWVSQSPHEHNKNDPVTFPDQYLMNAENYCRNPDQKPEGPWCYTADPEVRYEYCDIPMCDCKETTTGQEYNGKESRTNSGILCQRWDSQSPHVHNNLNLNEAENYCRNPDNKQLGPWCYTTDPDKRWEYCNVKRCECKMDNLGSKYTGEANETITGQPCQRWDQQFPHTHSNSRSERFPEKNVSLAKNYCRNPDQETSGPWCYTLNPRLRWQYCDVTYCPTATKSKMPSLAEVKTFTSCKRNRMGKEYSGQRSLTITGKTCQPWNSQFPHNHVQTDVSLFPEDTLQEASNYCRNPDGEPYGPWCYTTDPAVRWEYCSIAECDCKLTTKGAEYKGRMSITQGGYECRRWDSVTQENKGKYPDDSVTEANNYCRNPTYASKPAGPWCFTKNPDVPFDYCAIPECDCKKTQMGKEYTGRLDYTVSGRRCQRWDSQDPHSHKNKVDKLFPDTSVSAAENYCRNPDNESKGPWCYTIDKAVRWEFCAIDFCATVVDRTNRIRTG